MGALARRLTPLSEPNLGAMLVILLLILFGMLAHCIREEHERDKEVMQWLRQIVPARTWNPMDRADRENAYNTFRSEMPKSAEKYTKERFWGLLCQAIEENTTNKIGVKQHRESFADKNNGDLHKRP